jgi:hypothetical protein
MGRRSNRRAGNFCALANNFLPVALHPAKDGFPPLARTAYYGRIWCIVECSCLTDQAANPARQNSTFEVRGMSAWTGDSADSVRVYDLD